MLLYETLDTLLWVYGWPKYPTLSLQIPRTAFPKNLSENIDRVVKLVDNWPSLISKIPQKPNSASTANIPAPDAKSEYEAALDRFCAAISAQKTSDWEQIRSNIYTAGFAFYWLPCVSILFIYPKLFATGSDLHSSKHINRDEASGMSKFIRFEPTPSSFLHNLTASTGMPMPVECNWARSRGQIAFVRC